MNAALQRAWTIEKFLDWAGAQEERYEFDGFQPVVRIGGTINHNAAIINLQVALRGRLRGTMCSNFGPDLGVLTAGSKVRYPDALISCTKTAGTNRLAPDVRVVFEVVSPTSGRVDRIEKVRDYATVGTIRRYVIVETTSAGLLVLSRQNGSDPWTALTLTAEDTLDLPEIGISVPVVEIYEDVEFEEFGTP